MSRFSVVDHGPAVKLKPIDIWLFISPSILQLHQIPHQSNGRLPWVFLPGTGGSWVNRKEVLMK